MLAGAWGVKIDVDPDPDRVLEIKEYMSKIGGAKVLLENGDAVEILKGDVKERKGEAVLIFRYQLIS